MKAKVKTTGKIVNIVSCNTEFVSNYPYKDKPDTYSIENLEFLPELAPAKGGHGGLSNRKIMSEYKQIQTRVIGTRVLNKDTVSGAFFHKFVKAYRAYDRRQKAIIRQLLAENEQLRKLLNQKNT